jgi:hypothetical protein
MRTIIRCPNCFTYVYDDARRCHGCGDRIGKRKLLRRGSWMFIALAVAVFTIARGIDLRQDARNRDREEAEREVRAQVTRGFVYGALMGDSETISRFAAKPELVAELDKLRARYPTVLPATSVTRDAEVKEFLHQGHTKEAGKDISHANWGRSDPTVGRRASCVPPGGASNAFTRIVDGMKRTTRTWTLEKTKFEAEFSKDGQQYTLHGSLCLEHGVVCCMTIDRIESVNDLEEVVPKE